MWHQLLSSTKNDISRMVLRTLNRQHASCTTPNKELSKDIRTLHNKRVVANATVTKKLVGKGQQQLLGVETAKLETMLSGAPCRMACALDSLAKYFETQTVLPFERVWLAYRWVVENFDLVLDLRPDQGPPQSSRHSVAETWARGRGDAGDIAIVFAALVQTLGTKVETVRGYRKLFVPTWPWPPLLVDHVWSAVHLDGDWRLVDCAQAREVWALSRKYIPEYDKQFFGSVPPLFIRTCWPIHSQWQLLQDPISEDEFSHLLPLPLHFSAAGWSQVQPDTPELSFSQAISVLLFFEPRGTVPRIRCVLQKADSTPPETYARALELKGQWPQEGPPSREIRFETFVRKKADHFQIDVQPSAEGRYDLSVYCEKEGKSRWVFTQRLNVLKTIPENGLYPVQHPGYYELQAVLFEPLQGLLHLGSIQTFRIALREASEVVVMVGTNTSVLTANSVGVFEGAAEIDNSSVCIKAKARGSQSFTTVVEYCTPPGEAADLCLVQKNVNILRKNNIRNYPKTRLLSAYENQLRFDFDADTHALQAEVRNERGEVVPSLSFMQRKGTKHNVQAVFPRKGRYQLVISVVSEENKQTLALAYTVQISSNKELPLFPYQHQSYISTGTIVMEPLGRVLKPDTTQLFRLQAEKAAGMLVLVGENRYTLQKAAAGVFQGLVDLVEASIVVWIKPDEVKAFVPMLEFFVPRSLQHKKDFVKKNIEVIQQSQLTGYPKYRKLTARANCLQVEMEGSADIKFTALIKNSKDELLSTDVLVNRNGRQLTVHAIFSSPDSYRLILLASLPDAKEPTEALEYDVEVPTCDSASRMPKVLVHFHALGLQLEEPQKPELQYGSVAAFRLHGDRASDVQVVVGTNEYPLTKSAANEFEGAVDIDETSVTVRAKETSPSPWQEVLVYAVVGAPAFQKPNVKKYVQALRDSGLTKYPKQRDCLASSESITQLEFNHVQDTQLFATLQNDQAADVPGATFVQRGELRTVVETVVPNAGRYQLHILAVPNSHSSSDLRPVPVLIYDVIATSPGPIQKFPKQLPRYHEQGVELLEPKNGLLELNKTQEFHVRVSASSVLAVSVLVGLNSYPLVKSAAGVYRGFVEIEDPSVVLCTKRNDGKTFEPVLEYTVSLLQSQGQDQGQVQEPVVVVQKKPEVIQKFGLRNYPRPRDLVAHALKLTFTIETDSDCKLFLVVGNASCENIQKVASAQKQDKVFTINSHFPAPGPYHLGVCPGNDTDGYICALRYNILALS